MSAFKSDFLRTLDARGFIHQCTDAEALDEAASKGSVTVYVGYDCTADSLHIGNLVSIMMLRIAQATGHRPIALVGGGTSKIGDPSGKDESRQLLDEAGLERNKAGIRKSLSKFLDFAPGGARMVDNAEWLDGIGYILFLREIGTYFTINRMLAFDSVKTRLEREQPLTLLEFNYMVMQAYDFVELNKRYGCTMQMGGSDQWGNIVNGVELGRRLNSTTLFGLTTPLITTASGAKMGKTAQGAVWLNEDRRTPFDYWQFWRNTEDADVGRFLKIFTDLPLDEIAKLENLEGAELNDAKIRLATEATALAHGSEAAEAARASAAAQFAAEGSDLSALPQIEIDAARATGGLGIIELFQLAGLAGSGGEARRLIRGGGARLNDERIEDETLQLDAAQLASDGVKLSAGKKRHVVVRAR